MDSICGSTWWALSELLQPPSGHIIIIIIIIITCWCRLQGDMLCFHSGFLRIIWYIGVWINWLEALGNVRGCSLRCWCYQHVHTDINKVESIKETLTATQRNDPSQTHKSKINETGRFFFKAFSNKTSWICPFVKLTFHLLFLPLSCFYSFILL